MKFRKIRLMLLGVCLSVCMAASLAGCGSTDSAQDESDAAEEADSSDEDDDSDTSSNLILSLDDGTEVELAELAEDDAYIYGKFYYETDGSMWVFGGHSLSVGYYDEDGDLDVDIYDVGFYEAVDEDDLDYLYLVLTDVLEGTSACWYAANVTDDDGNVEGIALINPSDESYYYYLTIYDEDDDE